MSHSDGQRPMNGDSYGGPPPSGSSRAQRPSAGPAGGGRSRSGTNGPPPASSSGARHVRIADPSGGGGASRSANGGGRGGAGAGGVGGLQVPGARPQTNVGARLLKKRQSVSYHTAMSEGGIPGEGGAPPPMPAMPVGLIPGAVAQQQQQQGQGQAPMRMIPNQADDDLGRTGLDIDLLASESFKPEDLLKQNINPARNADGHMDDLKRLRTRLEGAMKITEAELQKSVFKNYADFVLISKEIATLENEMLELKGVLEEWRAVPESLEGGWGDDDLIIGGSSGPNRRTQRNSLADLATLYKSQLSALWEGVEGAQKFLPYVPGRHIITESASFVELHAATYKPKQQVHLFLLNDAMLVSVKKRRGAGTAGAVRLVAERCFNLSEIVVVDLKDGGDLVNAVKIKRGKETIIFRTDKQEDKKVLLLAFKKVAEELMAKKRKDMLSEAEARKGDPNAPRGSRQDYDGFSTHAGFSPAQILGLAAKDDPTGKDLSWIGDFSDELSVAIATREFEAAVDLVEKGKTILQPLASDQHASFLFRSKLDQRTSELVSALLNDLSDQSIRKSGVVRTTSWLLRLGQGERARETFLTGRGNLVRKRARQIKFEGDISMYISELAMVCFTLIKNTCEWYMAAFKDNRMASGFVRWASEQVEIYAETFRRQVYGADQDRKVIDESLEVTKSHGAMLRDVGLDFTFLLDGLLRPQVPPETKAVPRAVGHLRPGGGGKSAVAQARQSVFIMRGEQNAATAAGGGGGRQGADGVRR